MSTAKSIICFFFEHNLPKPNGGHVGSQYSRIFFSKKLHENGVNFPEERNAFVLDYQHGFRDVTCKPAI